jgi:hypothetical protein
MNCAELGGWYVRLVSVAASLLVGVLLVEWLSPSSVWNLLFLCSEIVHNPECTLRSLDWNPFDCSNSCERCQLILWHSVDHQEEATLELSIASDCPRALLLQCRTLCPCGLRWCGVDIIIAINITIVVNQRLWIIWLTIHCFIIWFVFKDLCWQELCWQELCCQAGCSKLYVDKNYVWQVVEGPHWKLIPCCYRDFM